MFHLIALTVAAAVLAGCGIAQQARIQEEADNALSVRSAAVESCQRNYTRGQRPVTPFIRCMHQAEIDYQLAMARSVGNPNLDIVRAYHAKELVLAEQFDRGHITEAQLSAETAQLSMEANNAIAYRGNNAAMVAAAQDQAAAARSAALITAGAAIMTAPPPPVSYPAPPRTTNCQTYGNRTNCSSW